MGLQRKRPLAFTFGALALVVGIASFALACSVAHIEGSTTGGPTVSNIQPSQAVPGTEVRVDGIRWETGIPVSLSWFQSDAQLSGPISASTAADGSFSVLTTVPSNANAGASEVRVSQATADGDVSKARAFEVLGTAAAAPEPQTSMDAATRTTPRSGGTSSPAGSPVDTPAGSTAGDAAQQSASAPATSSQAGSSAPASGATSAISAPAQAATAPNAAAAQVATEPQTASAAKQATRDLWTGFTGQPTAPSITDVDGFESQPFTGGQAVSLGVLSLGLMGLAGGFAVAEARRRKVLVQASSTKG